MQWSLTSMRLSSSTMYTWAIFHPTQSHLSREKSRDLTSFTPHVIAYVHKFRGEPTLLAIFLCSFSGRWHTSDVLAVELWILAWQICAAFVILLREEFSSHYCLGFFREICTDCATSPSTRKRHINIGKFRNLQFVNGILRSRKMKVNKGLWAWK